MRRRGELIAAALCAAAFTSGGTGHVAEAAPPSRCIAAAESGQQLRADGKLLAARKELGTCTALECPRPIRRDCARWVEELEAAIPTIAVRVEDANGADVGNGTLLLDGEPLGEGRDGREGRATPVDPGAHRLTWEQKGVRTTREIVVREGEKNRVVVLRLEGPPDPKEVHGAPVPPPSRAEPRSPVPWIVGGAGVVVAGVGIGLWGSGLADRSELGRTCAGAHACTDDAIDAARTKLVVGDVLVAAGIVLVSGALYFLLVRDAGHDPGRDPAPSAGAR